MLSILLTNASRSALGGTVMDDPLADATTTGLPGTFAVGIDPNDPSPRKGGVKDPMAPAMPPSSWVAMIDL